MGAGKEDNTQNQNNRHNQQGQQNPGEIVHNQDHIEKMAEARTGIHQDTIKAAFNACWDAICEELELGHEVKLHGKGSFYLSRRSSRVGRNPATGEEFDVPEREAMAFRTSPAYAKRLREIRKELAKQRQNRES